MLLTCISFYRRKICQKHRVYPLNSVKITCALGVIVYAIYLIICSVRNTASSVASEYNRGGLHSKVYSLPVRKPTIVNASELCDDAINSRRNIPLMVCTDYLLNNPSICSNVKYLLTLIVVNSVPGNFKQRDRMRSTIGNRTILPAPVRIVFLLGTVLNGSLQNQLKAEHNIYGDTVQGDFLDTYKNLTLKSVLGLKWVTEYCQNTEFVIRLEDDTTADIFYLLTNILSTYIGSTKTIFCVSNVLEKAGNVTNQWPTPDTRWFVSDARFETNTKYLFFNCVGYPAIISTDFIPNLYLTVAHAPSDMNNMTLYDIKDVVGHNVSTRDHECFRRRQDPCLFISGPEGMLLKYWEYVYEKRYDFISTAVDNLDIFEGF